MSKPSSRHSSKYRSTASGPWVRTRSTNPPVDTRTLCSWHRSINSLTARFGMRANDPPLNFRVSTYSPMVSRMSARYLFPIGA